MNERLEQLFNLYGASEKDWRDIVGILLDSFSDTGWTAKLHQLGFTDEQIKLGYWVRENNG